MNEKERRSQFLAGLVRLLDRKSDTWEVDDSEPGRVVISFEPDAALAPSPEIEATPEPGEHAPAVETPVQEPAAPSETPPAKRPRASKK
ncbi:hypothetical protein UFOVP1383_28 [uncultured Caudovirales phage]|uniref:Uncharacterized protein n=1 Tax=uncultured Caudovirales phage TaxID=2100421 RepID=A0A6J5QJB8_9CAUD|nr:hypothetical protein UFOVP848_13 [uncultured Caudovirales phage]CAB4173406.1 hypothetical protein UFOVP945_52 [uncultured Caudovirales phage]CAB4179684.1 hypothetical protein UFOVP1023_49 [uncultured Caudovirales phage]CAB4204077.1 hypothetical protein UFOVP1383_28 [uncultured Caudovirales phage]CAB4215889.1 hypothetical protein UFOVP1477_20 [uncultured Caudovirales phage]